MKNFVNHLGVYMAELLDKIGGFREGFEGSQDYDLALRCVERLEPKQVRHIPRILYHWRAVEGSLAAVADAKPYAKEAARRAIADHLKRMGVAARVEACPESIESHRVIYELPEPRPSVSIIIPTRDRAELLERCLASIREVTDYAPPRSSSSITVRRNRRAGTSAPGRAAGNVRVVTRQWRIQLPCLINCGVSSRVGQKCSRS